MTKKPEQLSLFPNKPDKPLVYVAGPYTKPDPVENTHKMVKVATTLLTQGVVTPVVPNLSLLWHLVTPLPYDMWLAYDFELLARCDALFRLSGESNGADKEEDFAEANNIPIFHRKTDLYGWSRARAAA